MYIGSHVNNLYSCPILIYMNFLNIISKHTQILPVEAQLFHADRRMDRHDEANSRFSQFCESPKKRLKKSIFSFDVEKGFMKKVPVSQII